MKRFKLSTLSFILCAASVGAGAQQRSAKGVFEIEQGRERKVKGTDLKIAFLEVTEDSRCPEGTTCVWAGNARVRMLVQNSQDQCAEFALNTNLVPGEFDFGDYKIRLQRLSPYPSIHAELKPTSYTAELFITKVKT